MKTEDEVKRAIDEAITRSTLTSPFSPDSSSSSVTLVAAEDVEEKLSGVSITVAGDDEKGKQPQPVVPSPALYASKTMPVEAQPDTTPSAAYSRMKTPSQLTPAISTQPLLQDNDSTFDGMQIWWGDRSNWWAEKDYIESGKFSSSDYLPNLEKEYVALRNLLADSAFWGNMKEVFRFLGLARMKYHQIWANAPRLGRFGIVFKHPGANCVSY